jgi:hypothetical protein
MPELTIKTSKTKVRRDSHLASRTFEASSGEVVITLMRVDGREKECDHLIHEWMHTIERTLAHADNPPYERLEGALKEINGLLKGTQITENIKEVNGIIAIFDNDGVLHVSQARRAEAYLTRDNSTVQITESSPTRSSQAQFLYISNGDIRYGDAVILSTERLLRCMTPNQISKAARSKSDALETIKDSLEAEKETAALALLYTSDKDATSGKPERPAIRKKAKRQRGKKRPGGLLGKLSLPSFDSEKYFGSIQSVVDKGMKFLRKRTKEFHKDLQHPTRKRRAHLLLIAAAIVVFVGIWSGFQFTMISRKSSSRADVKELVEKINTDIRTSENRQLMGDLESANAILNRAEEEARNVMQNESGLFRTEALDILDRIREKRESINNIVRLTPQLVANLTSRNADVSARGLIGIERGRSIIFDRQNLYSVIVNAVDEPQRLDGDNLILNGSYFDRYDSVVFLTKENRLMELIEGQPTAMKTDDPAGWLTGPDIETYIRFLYVLSPQNNQILKYERLSNRYSEPSEYNVNGDLTGALDMTIDSDVYVLRQGGEVTKLFRGEQRNFTIRNLPIGALENTTKIFKASDRGNIYFLDPEEGRVIVTRTDDDLGESLYLKQYVLEGDQIGTLQDLYIDPDETQLLILDEKRLYSINLQEG